MTIHQAEIPAIWPKMPPKVTKAPGGTPKRSSASSASAPHTGTTSIVATIAAMTSVSIHLGKDALQDRHVDRLLHVRVEAGLAAAHVVLLRAAAGHGDDAHRVLPELLAQAARQLPAVHLRHADVEEDELRPRAGREVQHRGRARRNVHLVAERAQQ